MNYGKNYHLVQDTCLHCKFVIIPPWSHDYICDVRREIKKTQVERPEKDYSGYWREKYNNLVRDNGVSPIGTCEEYQQQEGEK